ncbi:MAG: RNA polymerase sigma factor [Clostridia bacterium]|nr:RNA polymerase sigma factor [Clostridia bacterium]
MNPRDFEARIMAQATRYYRIAKSILGNDADCEDAMQEAMIKAWSNLRKLNNPQYFETWMCRILINECKTLLRRSKRRATIALSETIPLPEPPDPMVWEALQKIDIQHRVPLTLHHANGYTLQEAARILNLPVSTVKWRIHRGKQALSALLEKEMGLNETV